jgi:hypothetical protein
VSIDLKRDPESGGRMLWLAHARVTTRDGQPVKLDGENVTAFEREQPNPFDEPLLSDELARILNELHRVIGLELVRHARFS